MIQLNNSNIIVKVYTFSFHLNLLIFFLDFHPSYTFLTGTKKQIEQVARSYRVYFSKVDKEDDPDLEEDYLVDHSIVLYLLDKNGDFVDFFTQKMTAIDVAEKINKHMIELDKQ